MFRYLTIILIFIGLQATAQTELTGWKNISTKQTKESYKLRGFSKLRRTKVFAMKDSVCADTSLKIYAVMTYKKECKATYVWNKEDVDQIIEDTIYKDIDWEYWQYLGESTIPRAISRDRKYSRVFSEKGHINVTNDDPAGKTADELKKERDAEQKRENEQKQAIEKAVKEAGDKAEREVSDKTAAGDKKSEKDFERDKKEARRKAENEARKKAEDEARRKESEEKAAQQGDQEPILRTIVVFPTCRDTTLPLGRGTLRYMIGAYHYRRKFVTLGVAYTPSIATRALHIGATQFTEQKSFDIRQANEHSMFGQAFNLNFGVSVDRGSILSASYLHIRQGFVADSFRVNWKTGLNDSANYGPTEYRFENHGVGALYQYSGYQSVVNFAVDLGLYYVWTHRYYQHFVEIDNRTQEGLRKGNLLVYGGVGMNIRPVPKFEIRIMPTIIYNISSINTGTVLRTNFVNYGISASLVYRMYLLNSRWQ